MNLQYTFAAAAGGLFSAGVMYWIAIVLLSVLLAAEVLGIYVLIRKLLPLLKNGEDARHYAVAPLLYGAIPMPLQTALLVLVILNAVGAVLLAALVILLRVKGIHVGLCDLSAAEAAAEEPIAEETEAPAPVFADEEETPAAASPVRTPAPVVIPVYKSDRTNGQTPYVVERRVIETHREIIKETVIEKRSAETEELLRAVLDLMKLNHQERMSRAMEVRRTPVESVPAYAPTEDAEDMELEDAQEEAFDTAEADAEPAETVDLPSEEDTEIGGVFIAPDESFVGYDADTGCIIVARYRKSFEAKLIQSRPDIKKYYSAIKNALLGYEGTTSRITWALDTFTNDRTAIARINVRGKMLDLYLALEPDSLDPHIWRGRDVGEKKKYADTPFLFKVNSPRKLTLALELIQRTCEEHGLAPIDNEQVDYTDAYPMESNEELVARGLIREYLREKRPSTTFEFADSELLCEEPETEAETEAEEETPQPATFELADEEPAEEVSAETTEEASEEVSAETTEEASEEATEENFGLVPAKEKDADDTVKITETVKTTERVIHEVSYGTPETTTRTETVRTYHSRNPIDVITEDSDEPVESVAALAAVETEVEAIEEPVVEAPIEDEPVAEEIIEDEPVEEEPVAEEIIEDEPIEEEPVEEEIIEKEPEEDVAEITADVTDGGSDDAFAALVDDYLAPLFADETEEEDEAAPEEDTETLPVGSFGTYELEDEDDDAPFEGSVIVERSPYTRVEEIEESEETEEVEEIEEVEETEEIGDTPIRVEGFAPPAPPVKPTSSDNDPTVAIVDVAIFEEYFENGATVNLEALKRLGLVDENAKVLRVVGNGALKKTFTVEANHFTLNALRAISAADGSANRL